MNLWKRGILPIGWSCLYCTVPQFLQKTPMSSEQFWTWSTFNTSYWNRLIECVAGLDIHGEMFKGVGIGGTRDQKETWLLSLRVSGLIMQTCLCAVVGNRCRLWLRVKRLIIGGTPCSGLVLIGFMLLEDFLIYAEGTGFSLSWHSWEVATQFQSFDSKSR